MEQQQGHPCPECGAPREPDHTPTCACAERASEVLRETRTAEAAAAEDFDPLRIRPYVALDGTTPDGGAGPREGADGPEEGADGPRDQEEAARQPSAADATTPLPAVAPDAPDATSVLPAPLAPPPAEPSARDLSLFESTAPRTEGDPAGQRPHETDPHETDPYEVGPHGPDPYGPDPYEADEAPSRRRRRTAALAVAGTFVAVVAVAGYTSGLFSYETPSRGTALPDGIRASVPDTSAGPASGAPASGTPSRPPTSAAPSPSPTASASPSPSPSPSASSASPSPAEPSGPASPTPTASGTGDPAGAVEDDDRREDAPVLRRGDSGPEVTELQLRLGQLRLYNGEADGRFTDRVENALRAYQWSRGVRSDEPGSYGPETRAKLESETQEP
ncbi:peptidoglycan-binding protein [Streptomyces sp. NPDC052701]|uniref:peptidoglycan-binding domain-containing protein n=1 Tax=Streptomyces sp. NPDC052701 TaxID=3155533 RepID=UPI00342AC113